MKTVFTVCVTVQEVFQGPLQRFSEQTIALTPEDARSNVRERYRHVYQLLIDSISR